ncbi:hypothetical protein [Clostridium diolis]|uniref:Transposase family protein n=1 Tax=Clostridium diolis TaxID=223919 RepID=A0AAV3W587_9CLOT|nr:hypothetical protein [Clostridium diolis]GEA33620.1 hypothetical protein CDIOL_45430 [Clostridium diolis]
MKKNQKEKLFKCYHIPKQLKDLITILVAITGIISNIHSMFK